MTAGGTDTTLLAGGYGVQVSTDGGATWTSMSNGLPGNGISGPMVTSLATTPNGEGGTNWAAATADGVFISTNEGETWTVPQGGLKDTTAYSLDALGKNLFAGTAAGVFLSTDGGENWVTVDSGLAPGQAVQAFASDGTILYAGTGGGVWRRPISEMPTPVLTRTEQIPTRFALYQNYPNPFNPSTIITYDIPIPARVVLTVYDILGREVKTLVDASEPAGVHRIQWNSLNVAGQHVASGVYFYRIVAEGNDGERFVSIKKLVLLK